MKFLILQIEINFFEKEKFIEFTNVFSETRINDLENEIDNLCFQTPVLSRSNQLKVLRDLFRRSNLIKKTLLNKNLIQILKILTKKEKSRLLFDLAIVDSFEYPFDKTSTLDELFSFQGLTLGVLIKLDKNKSTDLNYLPKKRGNITFFKSSLPINLSQIYHLRKQKFLLIGFGNTNTIYKLNKNDANVNYLKEFGYNFGDQLKDKSHPLIF